MTRLVSAARLIQWSQSTVAIKRTVSQSALRGSKADWVITVYQFISASGRLDLDSATIISLHQM